MQCALHARLKSPGHQAPGTDAREQREGFSMHNDHVKIHEMQLAHRLMRAARLDVAFGAAAAAAASRTLQQSVRLARSHAEPSAV